MLPCSDILFKSRSQRANCRRRSRGAVQNLKHFVHRRSAAVQNALRLPPLVQQMTNAAGRSEVLTAARVMNNSSRKSHALFAIGTDRANNEERPV